MKHWLTILLFAAGGFATELVHQLLRETSPFMAARKGVLLTGSFFHRLGWPA
ncbi:hypothetical protein [Burkholderia ubonensis]|uniref:hypothetical protein n=1 Tax=Burkholderia ubonensis TaxID=101571 RepID=UPI000AEA31D8|nr:hypothetical protein [Burkholderia ubonensis]